MTGIFMVFTVPILITLKIFLFMFHIQKRSSHIGCVLWKYIYKTIRNIETNSTKESVFSNSVCHLNHKMKTVSS
jgi:hypothetical protein